MADDFLPEGYEVPQAGNAERYLNKLEEGSTKIRMLAKPIRGYEWHLDKNNNLVLKGQKFEKGDKPVRILEGVAMLPEVFECAKYFWVMPIYNYEAKKVQIFKLTISTIQKAIARNAKDADWGSPLNYDIAIVRVGKGFTDTEYSIVPKPAKEVDPAILKEFSELNINLDLWMKSEDPFKPGIPGIDNVESEAEVVVNPDDIPF